MFAQLSLGRIERTYRPFDVIIEFGKLKICELHCHALAFNTRSLGNSGKGSLKKQIGNGLSLQDLTRCTLHPETPAARHTGLIDSLRSSQRTRLVFVNQLGFFGL